MKKVKLTVLMPVYNGEKYLREAIDSILNQTFADYEFLIIDDGCTDSSSKIINSYRDQRIRCIKNVNNIGLVKSLNVGTKHSKGEYIARMDQDDISLPERLERQIAFLDINRNVGLCGTNISIINSQSEMIINKLWHEKGIPLEWRILWENPIAHPSAMLRREILVDNCITYNEEAHVCEDYDLWTRISLITKIARLDEVLLLYRKTDASVHHSNVDTANSNSLISNKKLICSLTGEGPPCFHNYLTHFYQALGYPIEFININLLKKWMDRLIIVLNTRWDWDQSQLNEVRNDSDRMLINYIMGFDKRLFIKKSMDIRNINFRIYVRILKIILKRLYSKLLLF